MKKYPLPALAIALIGMLLSGHTIAQRLDGGGVRVDGVTQGPVTIGGSLTVSGGINAGNTIFSNNNIYAATDVGINGKVDTASAGSGLWTLRNWAGTFGVLLKFDALPTVSSCGAGAPAVVAGSTPWIGAVTIGTTAVASCLITFNGTAYPNAAHCSGVVETTTAANARAMGYLATGTTLTIVPSAAWADSSVVNWNCASSP